MDFGICLPTKAKSWAVVQRAEELGFTHAWFYDTQLLSADVLVAMGATAMKTSRIKLCAGVLIPSNRIAPVAANALATLNALAPGRVIFGVSTGYTGRRTMGLGPVTLARLEAYVRVVEGLLQGKTVAWSEEGGTHKIRFLNPDLGLINISDPIPTFLSAFGPKARALTAKLGAGWIGSVSYPQREQEDIDDIRTAWRNNGHDIKDLYAVAGCGGCVLDDGEPSDSPRAMAQAGPYAAIAFHNLVEEDQFGSVFPVGPHFPFKAELEAYRKIYEKYEPADARYLSNHRGHLMFVRPEEKHISANVIRGLSLSGTRSELVERIRGLEAIGYNQVAVNMIPGHEDDMLKRWAEVMESV
jgi:alkanesulfonate monooxygenase SsuD/methylene tetrahydromethanopterin reductase-like flavin-dependent oxidoreductase (luciferase family)